jgi:vitamin K-dependent gamma-carboxylase
LNFQQLKQQLAKPVEGQILGVFRIAFGVFMAFEMLYYMKINLVKEGLLAPKVLFTYDFFEFIKPMSEQSMDLLLGALLVCALLIATGLLYRLASTLFFVGFMYIVLLDKGIWNNHMYLFGLLSFIFIFIDAHKNYSLSGFLKSKHPADAKVPYWNIVLLRIQIFVVYFFGGIAKLNYDWLVLHEPMNTALVVHGINSSFLAAFMAYSGLLFDIGVGIILFTKWKKWALPFIIFFNITNAFLFNDIGIFPFLMLVSTLIFWNVEDMNWLKKQPAKRDKKAQPAQQPVANTSSAELSMPVMIFLSVYLLFQFLFPLRYLLLPNKVDWSGEASYFAWRMKIQTREIKEFAFVVEDSTHRSFPVPVQNFITPMQIQIVSKDPRTLIPFAQMVKKEAAKTGFNATAVRAKLKVVFNGHQPAYVVDSNLNLLSITYSPFKKMEWLLPEPK